MREDTVGDEQPGPLVLGIGAVDEQRLIHLVVDEILRSERCKARYRLRTPVGPFEHDLAGPYAVRNGFAQAGGEELAHPLGVLRKVHQVVQQA